MPEFTFLNLSATPKGWNDDGLDMLWRYNLHYFDYINSTSPIRPALNKEEFVLRWISENPKGCAPGWDPYPTSLRIVNWVKWLTRNKPIGHEEVIRKSLSLQLSWLERHVEWHILANHLLANLKALVIGRKFLGLNNSKWMGLYKKEIEEEILPDGGHYERSIMYHAVIFEDVLDVIYFCGKDADWLRTTAEKMAHYLVNMTGPDGEIALFNDAANGIAQSTEVLCDYAKSLGLKVPAPEEFVDFPYTGYTRMTAGEFVLFVDTAPLGPAYQPGHAHADTLTYELYFGGQKLVTDVGTSEYRGSRRSYERSTAAHNVVEVDGCNSSEVWSSHRVGSRAQIVTRDVSRNRIFAAHNGYGDYVERELSLDVDGLKVVERYKGSGNCVTRVHLTGGTVRRNEDRNSIECGGLDFTGFTAVHDYSYATGFGRLEKGKCLSADFRQGEFVYNITKARTNKE